MCWGYLSTDSASCISLWSDEVNNWISDLWSNEFTEKTLGLKQRYSVVWNAVYDCIRSLVPHAQVGGSGTRPSLGYCNGISVLFSGIIAMMHRRKRPLCFRRCQRRRSLWNVRLIASLVICTQGISNSVYS